jgi:hypothetical protein
VSSLCDYYVLESSRATRDSYSDTNSNNYARHDVDPTTAGMPGRGSVKCNSGSTVAGATRLVNGASDTVLDGGVRFPGEFSVTAGAFTLGQVLNFGSLVYVTDCYGELHPLHGAASVGNKPQASPPRQDFWEQISRF